MGPVRAGPPPLAAARLQQSACGFGALRLGPQRVSAAQSTTGGQPSGRLHHRPGQTVSFYSCKEALVSRHLTTNRNWQSIAESPLNSMMPAVGQDRTGDLSAADELTLEVSALGRDWLDGFGVVSLHGTACGRFHRIARHAYRGGSAWARHTVHALRRDQLCPPIGGFLGTVWLGKRKRESSRLRVDRPSVGNGIPALWQPSCGPVSRYAHRPADSILSPAGPGPSRSARGSATVVGRVAGPAESTAAAATHLA